MRAFQVFGEVFKSAIVTDLPPPTLVFKASAKSVPASVQQAFIDGVREATLKR